MTSPTSRLSRLINLRLILVTDIAKHVYDNWPMDWEEEQVSSPNILRLIYQGRFLHGNVTLGALKLPLGKTTVMHLVARETLPEPNSQGNQNTALSCLLSLYTVRCFSTDPLWLELVVIL
uniref:Ubiquitin-like 3a n=1 Tax=Neogobius melanostomus TaxID=47308 RepID=A0A8C6TTL1_9GOBI